MNNTLHPLLSLTAGDLMSREVKAVLNNAPLRDAARQLTEFGVRGVPVVNESGRCVGVLSVSDLARWTAGLGKNRTPQPRTCSNQQKVREVGGRETVLCLLPEGVCPIQRPRVNSDGVRASICTEPHSVPTDWQVVEQESASEVVRDVMTTEVVSIGPDTPLSEVARVMLDRGVHRVVVLDPGDCPIGVVSVDDLLQVLAHPEIAVPSS